MTTNKYPFAKQTEFSIISMMIRHKNNVEVAVSHGLDMDCFYEENTRVIFNAIQRLYNRKAFIDQFTVMDEVTLMGSTIKMEQIKDLIDKKAEHSDNLIGYIEQLIELRSQRKIIEKIKTIEEISLTDKTADEKIERISNEIASVSYRKDDSRSYTEVDGFGNFLTRLQDTIDSKGKNVVSFGFENIDKTISLIPGSLHIITAPPGGGKTAFLQQVIDHNSFNNKRGLMFSLEMNYDQLMMRKIQSYLGIQSWKMHSGSLVQEEVDKIVDFQKQLTTNTIINDTPNIDIAKLKAIAKVENNKKKLEYIAIDYIQLIRAGGLKGKREDEEIKFISAELLGLAKDLNVPIIALAQMNRDFHKNEGRRPTMANLHGSSSLEKDALSITFLHRPGQFDTSHPKPNDVEVIIGKNRFGNSNSAKLYFDGEKVKFREYTCEEFKLTQEELDSVDFEGEKKKIKNLSFK